MNQAESTYRAFASKTAELAEVDIQRIRLQAEYAHAEKQLGARNAELTALQADQALRQQQEQQVAVRQAQSRQEADSLSNSARKCAASCAPCSARSTPCRPSRRASRRRPDAASKTGRTARQPAAPYGGRGIGGYACIIAGSPSYRRHGTQSIRSAV